MSGTALIVPGKTAEDSPAARTLTRYEAAKRRWDLYATVVDECYEFALPLRQRSWMGRHEGPPDVDRLFDSTAQTALMGFASQTLDDVWPADQTPFMLEAGPGIEPGKAEEANRKLSAVAGQIIQVINNSNFRSAAHETFQDYAISTGFLVPEAGDALTPIVFRSIPQTEAVQDTGPRGDTDALFHPRKPKVGQITTIWPKARLPEELARKARETPDETVEVVHAAERDWSARGEEAWVQRVIWKGSEAVTLFEERSEGVGSCPFIAISYSRASGEIMGRGPVMAALPDIKTVNMAKQLLLEHADLQASGIWMADDDGIINADTALMEPGSIIPRAPGSKGLENVVPAGDVRVLQAMVEGLQSSIREALFVNDLGDLGKTPRSATEVAQRTADRARRLAGAYGRLLTEFLFPVVARVWWLLKHQTGNKDLPGIDGDRIRVRPLSPLTRAQAQDDILRHTNFLGTLTQFMGPQAALLLVDTEKFVAFLADKMGVDMNLLRDKAQVAALTQQAMTMAQQAGMIPGAGAAPTGAPA